MSEPTNFDETIRMYERLEQELTRQLADAQATIAVVKEALNDGFELLCYRMFGDEVWESDYSKFIDKARAALTPDLVMEAARYREALAVVERVKDDDVLLSLYNYVSAASNPHTIAAELRAILLAPAKLEV